MSVVNQQSPALSLALLTLCCTSSIYADMLQTINNNTSINLNVSTGNLLMEQTYLDNYPSDKGNGPLERYSLSNAFALVNRPEHSLIFEAYDAVYPSIKTYTLGVNLATRWHPDYHNRHGFCRF